MRVGLNLYSITQRLAPVGVLTYEEGHRRKRDFGPFSEYLLRKDWLSSLIRALLSVTWGHQELASRSCPARCFAWAGPRWCGE